MTSVFILLIIVIIGLTTQRKVSLWAGNLVLAVGYIIYGLGTAIHLNIVLKKGAIDAAIFHRSYGGCYFFALLGGAYLLPVLRGTGKKKDRNKIQDEENL